MARRETEAELDDHLMVATALGLLVDHVKEANDSGRRVTVDVDSAPRGELVGPETWTVRIGEPREVRG